MELIYHFLKTFSWVVKKPKEKPKEKEREGVVGWLLGWLLEWLESVGRLFG